MFETFTIVDSDGKPYLTRYYLFRNKLLWLKPFFHFLKFVIGFEIYLHVFSQGDKDRDLHDHPWDFASFIIFGKYWEHTSTGVKSYNQGDFVLKKAEDAHRLEIEQGSKVITLVIHGRKRRDWGFHTADGWVHHREYLKGEQCEEHPWDLA